MSTANLSILSHFSGLATAVQTMLHDISIIDFGVVKEVIKNDDDKFTGIVRVAVSVAESQSDVRILTCPLITMSSTALAIDTIPEVDDKVLLLYPRKFDGKMFSKENNDIILNKSATGYSPFTAIAMLVNQFRPSDYSNFIKFEGKNMLLKYNNTEIKLNEDGSFSYTSFEVQEEGSEEEPEELSKISLDKDGNLTVSTKKDKDTSILNLTANENGVTLTDKDSNSIATSSSGITATDCNDNSVTLSSSGIALKALASYEATFSDSEAKIGALTIKKG